VEPVALRFDRDGPHLLVLGESGSGRTTALLTVASVSRVVDPSLPILALSPFGWTLPELVDRWEVDETGMLTALDELNADPRPALVLVDDADRLSRAVGERLLPLIRDAGRTGIRMVVAGRAVDVLRSYEDWLRYLTSLRVGLLLTPPPELESAFDLRPSRVRLPPLPGRGILVGRGTSTVVQVARRSA
jgi:S-DNA-T family DNA segregation ATPase FtsK/SpoIIIE